MLLPVSADQMFTVTTNKKEYGWNETILVSFKVNANAYSGLDLQTDTPDYKVVSQSTSTSINIVNGQTSHVKTFTIGLRAKRAGTISIPAYKIKVGDQEYSSNAFDITVLEPGQISKDTPKNVTSNLPFAVASVSKNDPYKHEQILMRLRFYHKGNVKDTRVPPLDFDNFIKEKIPEIQEYTEEVDGVEYMVEELNYILFPLNSGPITIPKIDLEVTMLEAPPKADPRDPLFGFSRYFQLERAFIATADPVVLNVKDLPNPPAGFTGYVGDLSVRNKIEKTEVAKGDAVTLTTELYGNGNLSFLELDLVPESTQYSIFKDAEEEESEIDQRVKYSSIERKVAVIPQKEGRISFTTKPVVYFNPILKRYETKGSKTFVLDVSPATAGIKNLPEQDKRVVSKKSLLNMSEAQINSYKGFEIPDFYGFLFLIILNFLAGALYSARFIKRRFFNGNGGAVSKIKFSELEKEIVKIDSMSEMSKLMKDVISKVDNNGAINQDLRESLNHYLAKCDQGNYGMASVVFEDLQQESLNLLKELRKVYGK